jgi:hypothetical protein
MPLLTEEVGVDFQWYRVPDENLTPCQSAIQRHLREIAVSLVHLAVNIRIEDELSGSARIICGDERHHRLGQIKNNSQEMLDRWELVRHLIVQWVSATLINVKTNRPQAEKGSSLLGARRMQGHCQCPGDGPKVSALGDSDRVVNNGSYTSSWFQGDSGSKVTSSARKTVLMLPKIPSPAIAITKLADMLIIQRVAMRLAEVDPPHGVVLVDREITDLLQETFRVNVPLALDDNFQSKILDLLAEHEAREMLLVARVGSNTKSPGVADLVRDGVNQEEGEECHEW